MRGFLTAGGAGLTGPQKCEPARGQASRPHPQERAGTLVRATQEGCAVTPRELLGLRAGHCGCSSMVEHQLPKLNTRVRFPSSAPPPKAQVRGMILRRWAFVVSGRVEPQAVGGPVTGASRFLRVCAARSRPDQRRTGDKRPATSLIRSTI